MPTFWTSIFHREGVNLKKARCYAFTHLGANLAIPGICVFIGCAPVFMEMIGRKTRTLEHPAEVDSTIIRDIYFGRAPKKSSFATDRTDNRNAASWQKPESSESSESDTISI